MHCDLTLLVSRFCFIFLFLWWPAWHVLTKYQLESPRIQFGGCSDTKRRFDPIEKKNNNGDETWWHVSKMEWEENILFEREERYTKYHGRCKKTRRMKIKTRISRIGKKKELGLMSGCQICPVIIFSHPSQLNQFTEQIHSDHSEQPPKSNPWLPPNQQSCHGSQSPRHKLGPWAR